MQVQFPSTEDKGESVEEGQSVATPSTTSKSTRRTSFRLFGGKSGAAKKEESTIIIPAAAISDSPTTPPRRTSRRVSFSPSIEEAVEAREVANATAEARERRAAAKAAQALAKVARREAALLRKAGKREGGTAAAAAPSVPERHQSLRHRRPSLTVDRKGIHVTPRVSAHAGTKERKSAPAVARITRKSAVAARHARLIETLILASSGSNNNNNNAEGVVPKGVTTKQMRHLKSALMDREMATDIVGQLRGMKLPDAALLQDVVHEAGYAAPSATSAAVEALEKLHSNAASTVSLPLETSARFGGLRKRLSSSGASSASSAAKALAHQQATAAAAVKAKAKAHPVKAVWLECCEEEALTKHHAHVSSNVSVEQGGEKDAGAAMGKVAGAGMAVWGAVLWLGYRCTPARTPAEIAVREEKKLVATASRDTQPTLGLLSTLPQLPQVPTIPSGPLQGVSPISLLLSPGSTLATAAASQPGGAFDQMANFTALAVALDTGGLDAMGNVRPPLDRVAVFVHWWGFELTLPEATMSYLGRAQSISGTFFTFLQTMVVSGGLPELLPFVKYISQFVELEFSAIKSQDRGDGVVVAATWLMPFALVPRPWDYSLEPVVEQPAPAPSLPTPAPSEGAPLVALRTTLTHPRATEARNTSPSPTRTPPTPKQEAAVAAITLNDVKPAFALAAVAAGARASGSPRHSLNVRLDSLAELPEGSLRVKAAA